MGSGGSGRTVQVVEFGGIEAVPRCSHLLMLQLRRPQHELMHCAPILCSAKEALARVQPHRRRVPVGISTALGTRRSRLEHRRFANARRRRPSAADDAQTAFACLGGGLLPQRRLWAFDLAERSRV